MSYSILSHATRQQLEQERSRLRQDRAAIIQTAIEQATAQIDKTLQHLDTLLGDAPALSESQAPEQNGNGKSLPDLETSLESVPSIEPIAQESSATSAKAIPKAKGRPSQNKGKSRGQQKSTSFDSKVLRPEFEGHSPISAMAQMMGQSPDRSFSVEEVISALYPDFDPAETSKATRSVHITLALGAKKGLLEKVQENPSRFKAVAGAKPEVASESANQSSNGTASTAQVETDVEESSEAPVKSPRRSSIPKAQPRAKAKGRPSKPASAKAQPRAKAKGASSKSQSFDAKSPKPEFKDMEPLRAMVSVTAATPNQPFSTIDIIREVYGEFQDAELARAIKSVAGTLARGVKKGFLEKVQNHPALFQFKSPATAA
jgi:hypothetical protein